MEMQTPQQPSQTPPPQDNAKQYNDPPVNEGFPSPSSLLEKIATNQIVNTLFSAPRPPTYAPPPQASPQLLISPSPDPYHLNDGGPPVLRAFCFIGGLSMFLIGGLSVLNILAVVTGPLAYVIQSFHILFGLAAMLMELKDMMILHSFQRWTREWFKFLTSLKGKGCFYLFVGVVDASLGFNHFITAVVGAYVACMGGVCVAYSYWAESKTPTQQVPYWEAGYANPHSPMMPGGANPRYQVTTVTTY